MLNSIYHMDSNYLRSHFWREIVKILVSFTQPNNGRHYTIDAFF